MQEAWMRSNNMVMVATNAFGMGIDKPNVRFVVHLDLPECLEAYFQEAGRAGRDEQKAYAVLLFNEANRLELEQNIISSFPSIDEIRQTYRALANYYQLAIGSGTGISFDFDITDFCNRYNLNAYMIFNCMRFLEKEGYLVLTESFFQPSRINFMLNKEDLYKFQVANPAFDNFIKLLLRSYPGMFDGYSKINETELARRTGISREELITVLNKLHQYQILSYIAQTSLPQVTFSRERVDAQTLSISKENLTDRKANAIKQMEWMIL
jgi:ATP-dependent DNA helicase RecQ